MAFAGLENEQERADLIAYISNNWKISIKHKNIIVAIKRTTVCKLSKINHCWIFGTAHRCKYQVLFLDQNLDLWLFIYDYGYVTFAKTAIQLDHLYWLGYWVDRHIEIGLIISFIPN
jgi:hypothetical protein